MKDCRYVDDDFILRYEVIDDKIRVYYSDGCFVDYCYCVSLEKELLGVLKRQLYQNVMFKDMRKRDGVLSKGLFYILFLGTFVSFSCLYDSFSFSDLLAFLGFLGFSVGDFAYFIRNDKLFKEILKEEYYIDNMELFDDIVGVNDLDNFSFNDLVDIKKGLVKKK